MKVLIFSFVVLLSCSFNTSSAKVAGINTCLAPANLNIVSQNYNSVSFDWDDCNCSLVEYQVYYVINGQTSFVYSTNKSDFSFSSLPAGSYQFYFYTVCGTDVNSIIIEDVIMG